MKKFYTNKNNNYIFNSTIKGAGRGLFAGKDYKKGEIIDINPFIEIIPRGNVNSYSWGCPWNSSIQLVVLGNINFINEPLKKDDVNSFIFHYDKINKKIMTKATKDIKKDEEIFTYYGEKYDRSNY